MNDLIARPGETYPFTDRGEAWLARWHDSDEPNVEGINHGAAGLCRVDQDFLIVSTNGVRWEIPGGRPEAAETNEQTLRREILEEACARVVNCMQVGYISGHCLTGSEAGTVLVRSLWVTEVELLPWHPEHEMAYRELVSPPLLLNRIEFPTGQLPIFNRWLQRAIDGSNKLGGD